MTAAQAVIDTLDSIIALANQIKLRVEADPSLVRVQDGLSYFDSLADVDEELDGMLDGIDEQEE